MSLPAQPSIAARLRRLWPYANSPRWAWVVAAVATVVLSLTEPLIPAMMQPLLDKGFNNDKFNLWLVPVLIILIFLVKGLANFIAQMALAKLANLGILKIRQAMFAKLLTAEMGVFSKQTSSSLSNTLVYEVQTGAVLLVQSVMSLTRDSLSLLSLVGYLMYLNWRLTLIVAILFPAVALVMRALSRRLYGITKEAQDATDKLAYVVEENVLAHKDIRLHAAQAAQSDRFLVLGSRLSRLFMKSTAASAAMTPVTQLLAAFALSAVITVALVQSADNTTTVGSFAAFITAMLMLIAPIKHLSEIATPITRGLAALERGLNLLDEVPDQTSGAYQTQRASGALEFRNVAVSYDDGATNAVSALTLTVRAGETVALVGASGSGKTTLVSLLPRFVEATAGELYLDGIDIRDWNLQSLRNQFGQVSQHVYMLNDSIANNIALGQVVDRVRVTQCLSAANLLPLVNNLPQGMDAMVGHNAMQLSGGQRQRMAIARALYKDAPILILDEATSALDTESEKAVQEALERLMKDRTTLVIAHRLSTVQHADRIVVMSCGSIVEVGTHAELLALEGHYARLYRLGLTEA